mmetsp:Transcript_41028/g.132947  ORF Transcript_41028/g.132947 Transcript_41028/m.132947 type:complete len:271 (+) Transcript_41028:365-1177(+)
MATSRSASTRHGARWSGAQPRPSCPKLFAPNEKRLPSCATTSEKSPPHATARGEMAASASTQAGKTQQRCPVAEMAVAWPGGSTPSCPCLPSPNAYTRPSAVVARECAPPAATIVTASPSGTADGVGRSLWSPSPSRPASPHPKASSRPPRSTARLCDRPPAADATFPPAWSPASATCAGVRRRAAPDPAEERLEPSGRPPPASSPRPSWPCSSEPKVKRSPSRLTTSEWKAPAATDAARTEARPSMRRGERTSEVAPWPSAPRLPPPKE